MPVLSYKYRIYPNRAQVSGLTDMLGSFCDLYNACLQQRIEAYQRQGKSLGYYDQANELKDVRAVDDRLAGYSFSAEQQIVRRIDKAFKAFFGRVKKGKSGFPRFRAKSRFDSADFRVGDGLSIRKTKRLTVVGIPGQIKVKWHRDIPAYAKVGVAVVSRSCGKWYVCFQITLPELYGPWLDKDAVGIDVGLSSLVATSDGETIATPQFTKDAAKKQRRLQRALARAKRGSKGRLKAKRNLARHSARIANRRRDFAHKLSRNLVKRYSLIAVEDLNVSGLARSILSKSVHNAAWTQLRAMIEYKAENAGVRVIAVNPRGTSQTCPECGAVAAKTLATRVHNCAECGCVLDRDVAAAQVILHRALTNCGRDTALKRQVGGLPRNLLQKPPVEAGGVVTSFRKNPASIAEMLAIVAERNAMYAPKSDEQLALDYPDNDADDDAKWFDGDPAWHDEERILERVEATVERRGFMKIG